MENQKLNSVPIKDALGSLLNKTAKTYYKEKLRAEKKNKVYHGRISSDYSWGYIRKYDASIRDLVMPMFPGAIKKVSSDDKYRFTVRQLYYVVRPMYAAEDAGQRDQLDYNYFMKLLEDYEKDIGRRVAMREVSGEMVAPHNAEGCALGTAEVAEYVVPKNKFNKIIYIEKRGFIDPIIQSDFHNRFDVAVAAGVGFSTWAARDLLVKMKVSIPITILCAHDADIAGYDINRTLGSPSPFSGRQVEFIELGLTPKQVMDRKLEIETYSHKSDFPSELAERLTPKEVDWLKGGNTKPPFHNAQRVELNVFTPEQFLEWLEERMGELKIKGKVRPEKDAIKAKTQESILAYTGGTIDEILSPIKEKIIDKLCKDNALDKFSCSKYLDKKLAEFPPENWEEIIDELVKKEISKTIDKDDPKLIRKITGVLNRYLSSKGKKGKT